jgi:SPP1 gp7 family putative phage head morphogenesis protein
MTKEQKLQDALIRHQVYLEGLKLSSYEEAEEAVEEVERDIIALLIGLGVATLSALTIKKLNGLIARIRDIVGNRFTKAGKSFLKFIDDFTRVERRQHREILKPFGQPTKPVPTLGDTKSKVRNAIVPGTGMLTAGMISDAFNSMREEIVRMVRMGYANEETLQDLIKRIVGDAERGFKDGWLNKAKRKVKAVFTTVVQHVSSQVGKLVQETFFSRYQWVSVIDEKTTEICTERDGNVYTYGQGPLPPAHYNCRSTVTPYVEGAMDAWEKTDWFEWATSQPREILEDMIGRVAATEMTEPGAKATDFPRLQTARRLTLPDYESRITNMMQ